MLLCVCVCHLGYSIVLAVWFCVVEGFCVRAWSIENALVHIALRPVSALSPVDPFG